MSILVSPQRCTTLTRNWNYVNWRDQTLDRLTRSTMEIRDHLACLGTHGLMFPMTPTELKANGNVLGDSIMRKFCPVTKPIHLKQSSWKLSVLGFDHERLTYRFAGRDFRLTDVYGKSVHELFT